jgi:LysR family transcriptional regulator, hydrogen peroxide-inducible genes activator
MELYQIRYFLAVAETLNFTRAAERSFVSQSALTKAIQRLEEIVGGRLLDRSSKSVQLTTLGLSLLPNFKQINDSTLEARLFARKLVQDASQKNAGRSDVHH